MQLLLKCNDSNENVFWKQNNVGCNNQKEQKFQMVNKYLKFGGLLVTALLVLNCNLLQSANVYNLRCEYLVNPLGVDVAKPRLSWMLNSQKRGETQTAYEVLVASSVDLLTEAKADVWNSGKLNSDKSIQVEYEGIVLRSDTKYFWKVRVWDRDGKVGNWSTPAFWSMGLLAKSDWGNAHWIAFKNEEQWKTEWKQHKDTELSHKEGTWPLLTGQDLNVWDSYRMAVPRYDPSPLFRKEFSLHKKVESAYLYICGLGYYEAFLNGERVGDHVLDPAWTNFDKRSFYVVYDVAKQLREGLNAMGVMLGRGQYNPLSNDVWGLSASSWVDQPKLVALLKVKYTDGTTQEVVTNKSWKTIGGPIVFDDTRKGELYDARLEPKGWSLPWFNDGHWQSASPITWSASLQSQMIPPIRCFAPIIPQKVYTREEGRTIYDLGKNIAGWARVKVSGPAGAKVLVEYCELPSDKKLVPNIRPNRMRITIKDKDYASFYDSGINIRQQNGYILRGGSKETFECHFSYKGFQFIRVTVDKGVRVEQVTGIPVHTDVENAGSFTCSDSLVNRLQENSRISLLSNFHGIATDCPHREKQGWTADNYLSCEAAMYNFNMASFYTKWIADLAGTQGKDGGLNTVAPSTSYVNAQSTVWPAAMVFVPWNMLGYYADTNLLDQYYGVMLRFAKSSLQRQVDGKPEIINDVLGDWVAPLMTLSDSLRNNTMAPPEGHTLYGTASHFLVVKHLAAINKFFGRNKEEQEMGDWANRIKQSFNKEFFDSQSNIYHGDKITPYRQSANVVPLDYGIVPDENRSVVINNLIADIHTQGDRLSTGFVGTMALMDYLPVIQPELSYKLVTQKSYPGWGYMVAQGANSMWETWDGDNSLNHAPFCLISAYFYKHLAGIQCDWQSPGFRHIIINPSIVGDLRYVNAYHNSMYGRIGSSWKLENGKLMLKISIPANCTATIYIPTKQVASILESGHTVANVQGVTFLREESGKAVFEVGSGNYNFQSAF